MLLIMTNELELYFNNISFVLIWTKKITFVHIQKWFVLFDEPVVKWTLAN